jgi:hypothetical protein
MFLADFPPPAIYDHPYTGPGDVLVMPLAELRRSACAGVRLRPGHVVFGCSLHTKWACTIIIPTVEGEVTAADQATVLRVESANCNGWPKGDRE